MSREDILDLFDKHLYYNTVRGFLEIINPLDVERFDEIDSQLPKITLTDLQQLTVKDLKALGFQPSEGSDFYTLPIFHYSILEETLLVEEMGDRHLKPLKDARVFFRKDNPTLTNLRIKIEGLSDE